MGVQSPSTLPTVRIIQSLPELDQNLERIPHFSPMSVKNFAPGQYTCAD